MHMNSVSSYSVVVVNELKNHINDSGVAEFLQLQAQPLRT